MAKRRTVTETTEEVVLPTLENVPNVDTPPESDTEITDAELLSAILATEGSDDLKWSVYRMAPNEGHCQQYNKEDLSLDNIRRDYGGGKYRIRGLRNGKYVLGTSTVVSIVEPVKPKSDTHIAELLSASQNNPNQFTAMVQMQGELLKTLLAKEGPRVPSAAESRKEMLETMALMKEIFSQPKVETSSTSEMIKLLMQGITLGKGMGGDGGLDWISIAAQGIDAVKPVLSRFAEKIGETPPAAIQRVTVQSVQNPATLQPAHEPTQEDSMLQLLNWLSRQLNHLVQTAIKQKNPQLYAEVFLDNLPPFVTVDMIRERMNAPDALEQLGRLNKQVLEYRPWFEKFREAVIEMLTDDVDQPSHEEMPNDES